MQGTVPIVPDSEYYMEPDGVVQVFNHATGSWIDLPKFKNLVRTVYDDSVNMDHPKLGRAMANIRTTMKIALPEGGDYSVDQDKDILVWNTPPIEIVQGMIRIGVFSQEKTI